MIDARRLLVFKAVAEAGSFSAAAADLHLSQPSVSRAVAGLELSVGVTLLQRRPDGIALTEAGARVLERARIVASHLERATEELAAIRDLEAGRVIVGSFPTVTRTFLVEALRAVHEAHPNLQLEDSQVGGRTAATAVAGGAVDVGIGFELHGEPPPEVPGVGIVAVLTEPMYAAVPRDHRLAARRRIELAELAADPWIQGAGPASPRLVERMCRRAGFEPRIVARSDSTQSLVAAGLGVTLVPSIALVGARPDIRFLPLDDPPRRDIFAARLAGVRAPAVDAVLDALRRASRHAATAVA